MGTDTNKDFEPNYYHHACECILIGFIAMIVWPWYLLRPRDYFRDVKKAFVRAEKEFLKGESDA